MNEIISSVSHLRTTLPGVGLVILALGHWWVNGHLSDTDVTALLGAFGLISAEGKA